MLVGACSGPVEGSVWIEGPDIHYINEGGTAEYRVYGPLLGTPNGEAGSVWVESTELHWLAESTHNEHWAHEDVPSHLDVPHSNVAHSDTYSDVAHSDTHGDVAHGDGAHLDTHGDSGHGDSAHVDSHTDTPILFRPLV